MENDNDIVAKRGEDLAAEFLIERGWEIVERNWTSDIGELDIVARTSVPWGDRWVPMLAFVEVKTTANAGSVPPECHVNVAKRRKIVTLARLYMAKTGQRRAIGRFDVFGIDLEPLEIRHFPDAFDAAARLR